MYRWSIQEDELLIDLINRGAMSQYGFGYELEAALPGKNQHAIRVRRKQLIASGRLVPRPKWTPEEDALIISMSKQGATLDEIKKHFEFQSSTMIKNRRQELIDAGQLQAPTLYRYWSRQWSPEEDAKIVSLVEQGVRLKDYKLHFPNDTITLIKHRITHLRSLGIIPPFVRIKKERPAPTCHKIAWTRKEILTLREYSIAQNLGAQQIFNLGVLPGRSVDSIAQQIRRRDFANPKRQVAARKAYQKRLTLGASTATLNA